MEETLKVSYIRCGFCTAKNHCAACGGEAARALARRPGVREAEADASGRVLRVVHDLDREALEDLLDGMGILAE